MADSQEVIDYLQDLHEMRLSASADIANYDLPEVPEIKAAEIYERIIEEEKRLVAPNLSKDDYLIGTAHKADTIYSAVTYGSVLLTAEHATDHFRINGSGQRERKIADWGTAGLGAVAARDIDASFMTMQGRQTADANNDLDHPFKEALREVILLEDPLVVAGLHGVRSGKFEDFTDTRGFDILIGIGKSPNETSVVTAEKVKKYAENLGLRAGINQLFIKTEPSMNLKPVHKEDGSLAYNRFAAATAGTTRAFAAKTADELGKDIATLQLEFSELLRIMPQEYEVKDLRTRQMGAYLGYLVVTFLQT